MKDFPGGTWIVLEVEDGATGIDLVCISYKYNKKKVLTFVLSKGAGSTLEGEPHEARFPDRFGNVCIRHVARPQVVPNFFKYCNVIDLHNQVRQFDLALEKMWVTQNGYFRLYATMLGMTVTDLWKTMSKSFYKSNRQYTITKFADILARDQISIFSEVLP